MHYIDIHKHNSKELLDYTCIISVDSRDLKESFNSNSHYSIGIHPWYLDKNTLLEEIKKIENGILQKEVIAIGECGLDRFSMNSLKEFELQLKAFNLQADIAFQHNKPMILHAVNSYSDFLHWLKDSKKKLNLIFHGFNGNMDIVDHLSKYNCWFSFGESLLNSSKIQGLFQQIPLDKCFLETDESNFSITEIYKKAAEIKELELDQLANQISKNFRNCFHYES